MKSFALANVEEFFSKFITKCFSVVAMLVFFLQYVQYVIIIYCTVDLGFSMSGLQKV